MKPVLKPVIGGYLVQKDKEGPYQPMPHLGNVKWSRYPERHDLSRISVEFDVLTDADKAEGLISRQQANTDAEYIAMLAIACMTEKHRKQLVAQIVAERIA